MKESRLRRDWENLYIGGLFECTVFHFLHIINDSREILLPGKSLSSQVLWYSVTTEICQRLSHCLNLKLDLFIIIEFQTPWPHNEKKKRDIKILATSLPSLP